MLLAWAIAYLLAGTGFVAKDMSEPAYNRPGYVHTAKGRWQVRLLWPLVSVRLLLLHLGKSSSKLKHEYIGGQFLPSLFVFVGVGAVGTLIANWLFD